MTSAALRRAIIFAGGELGEWAAALIQPNDYIIGADRGALYLAESGLPLHLAVGDFDSIDPQQLAYVRQHAGEMLAFDAVDKDWTDSELALREALARGWRDVVIVGGLGSRFDHTLANVYLLCLAADEGCSAVLVGEHNEIRLLTGPGECRLDADPRFEHVSLLPIAGEAAGITLSGFVYPLNDATLRMGMTLGVSNKLAGTEGIVELGEGRLLLIRSRD
ncbi:thiamine diphosphokinase [Cohnella lubricantis]|uniref:Thiamine diphosphokinase n=1 Tax=Cohnella lubricantis TaxID=2163172 RepID=A0A841T3L9_9BACL|nr:thiamine diphosphokinase [Cohnella lubricantis]MBB6676183.1 thiamine diphosphokinase [Cohnella lubricantis]MBP2118624.1 thiamine pyrophosphokinase [Cohnella lubricantis]